MKRIHKAVMLLALLITFNGTKAQVATERRPQLFASFSNIITFPKAELEKIFTLTEGSAIKLSLGGNVGLTGVITSSISRYHNLHSAIVRLNNLDNTIFGISKRTNEDNTITYIGRIINTKYADAFELKADANGNYFINKIKTAELIEDQE